MPKMHAACSKSFPVSDGVNESHNWRNNIYSDTEGSHELYRFNQMILWWPSLWTLGLIFFWLGFVIKLGVIGSLSCTWHSWFPIQWRKCCDLKWYLMLQIWYLKFCIQEPFVNIPEDTIREALKVVLGNTSASTFFLWSN